jgi:hypothetical protein
MEHQSVENVKNGLGQEEEDSTEEFDGDSMLAEMVNEKHTENETEMDGPEESV